MQANSDKSSSFASADSKYYSGKLLIPRSQRRMFCFQFTLMTVIGWVAGGIASIAIERVIWQSLPATLAAQPQIWNFWIRLIANIVFAVLFAADQALVVRRYFPFWRWLLATSLGWLLAHSVSTAWINYISTLANSLEQSLASEVALTLGLLSTILYILSGIWFGLCQWLVLRRYTVKAWWWNFLPSVAFLCISMAVWVLSVGQSFIPELHRTSLVYWSQQGITAMILGVVPAIGLCRLKKRSQRQAGIASRA
ncbi:MULTISPECIES: hypothetical protein [unclassified Anabaena]|uniref:hypothetical protein n=1 Tax=unclassified Anabaena TaxID=2619674 RepID=UPI000833033A|nr:MULTISPECIES: hypothetical protein [unclassified Anabaena]